MTARTSQKDSKSQIDKFKEAAHELEADESEQHWEDRLKKVVKQKPSENSDEL